MKHFLLYVLKVAGITLVVLIVVGFVENHFFRQGTYYKSQWINQIRNESHDVLFIGNSRGALFELRDDSTAYTNLSEDGSGLKTTYCQLYLYFKNGNKVDLVLFDVDVYSLRKTDDEKRSPRWLPFFNDSTIQATLENEHRAFKIYDYLPAITYATFKYDWNVAAFANNAFRLKESPWGKHGFMHTCTNYIDESPKGVSNFDSLPPEWEYLDKIHQLCKAHGATLKLFTSPYYEMLDAPSPNPIFLSELKERNLSYVDHSRIYLKNKKYFRDNRHLNCDGVHAYVQVLENEVISNH